MRARERRGSGQGRCRLRSRLHPAGSSPRRCGGTFRKPTGRMGRALRCGRPRHGRGPTAGGSRCLRGETAYRRLPRHARRRSGGHDMRHGRMPGFQRLHPFRQRFQRQVGIGPHHARERDLEGQAQDSWTSSAPPTRRPSTPSMRARRSGPNSGSSSASSRRTDSPISSATSSPANANTYMLRMCSARSRTNCGQVRRRSPRTPSVEAEARGRRPGRPDGAHDGAPRPLGVGATPSMRSAASMRDVARRRTRSSCSSEVRALRMPPSARCAMRSSAWASHSTPSATQTAPRRDDDGLGGDAAEVEPLAAGMDGLGHLLRVGGGTG